MLSDFDGPNVTGFSNYVLQGQPAELMIRGLAYISFTDKEFSVFAEETGFIGVILLISLLTFIILKGLNIAFRAADRFGFFLSLGLIISISFYMIFNIGMTIGIFPITGIPLPFLSYGGSSLITNFFAVGLLLNVEMRRTLR